MPSSIRGSTTGVTGLVCSLCLRPLLFDHILKQGRSRIGTAARLRRQARVHCFGWPPASD